MIKPINTTQRLAIVIVCLMAVLASLAFVGVHFAEKPVSWMPTAFLIVVLLLIVGIVWTINPCFVAIQSTGLRYTLESISVAIAVLIIAFLAYTLFGNLWFLFGGSL